MEWPKAASPFMHPVRYRYYISRKPAHLNRRFLARINNLPIDWQGQREMLGFV